MIKNTEDVYEIDLLKLFGVLWENVIQILLVAILVAALVFAYTAYLVKPEYQANVKVYVNNSSFSLGSTNFSINSSDLSAAQSLVETYIVILGSRTTLNEVIRTAGVDYSYQELSKMISAKAVNSTEIFEIVVTDTDPSEAQLIANTIAEVLPEKIANIVDGSSVRIVDYAVKPVVKSAPSNTKNTAIGFLIGFVLACAYVVITNLFDDVIRSEEYLDETFDIPVLAAIPDLSKDTGDGYAKYRKYYKNSRYGYGRYSKYGYNGYGKYGYKYGKKRKKEMQEFVPDNSDNEFIGDMTDVDGLKMDFGPQDGGDINA